MKNRVAAHCIDVLDTHVHKVVAAVAVAQDPDVLDDLKRVVTLAKGRNPPCAAVGYNNNM